MGISGIYRITNLKNGKVYIGSTINFDNRWWGHRNDLRRDCHHNVHLQHSWNKHGEDTFEFGILEYLNNLDELVKAEQFWMDTYRGEGKELYNIGECADNSMRGVPMSDEHKRKIGDSNRGNKLPPMSEETKRNMFHKGMLGKKHSEESKRRMSESQMGNQYALGHKVSKEARQRMSESGKRVWAIRHARESYILDCT